MNLLFIAIVVIIIISALIIIVINKPDFWFWIFLNLFFDPGGYVYVFLGGSLLGPLHITDVFISAMVICLISIKFNWRIIYEDRLFLRFLLGLLIFALYFYIVYGGVAPFINHDFDYLNFLIKNRVFAYSFVIFIAVYVFSLRGLHYFYTSTLFIGTVCLTLFFISLFTGVELIPIAKAARYAGDEMKRISMFSYGIFYLLFPVALATYLLSRKITLNFKYKYWLYYSGILMIVTVLITLTRRLQIDIIGTTIIIIAIMSYLFQIVNLATINKIIIPILLVLVALYITFPKYAGYVVEIGQDTFLLITTGKDSKGESDERVTSSGALDITKEYISENLFIGNGYTYLSWEPGYASSKRGARFARACDAAGEVPIYYLLFAFGIVGATFMLPLYFMMGHLFFKLMKLLRLTLLYYINAPLIIIISTYLLLTIVQRFTLNIYALSSDFTYPGISFTAIFMGMGFAIYRQLYLNSYNYFGTNT